jgi:hypothetical protein
MFDIDDVFGSSDVLFELAIMALFHHENVIEILAYSEAPLCIVMRHYDTSLHKLIEIGDISSNQAIKFINGIASGLAGKEPRMN